MWTNDILIGSLKSRTSQGPEKCFFQWRAGKEVSASSGQWVQWSVSPVNRSCGRTILFPGAVNFESSPLVLYVCSRNMLVNIGEGEDI